MKFNERTECANIVKLYCKGVLEAMDAVIESNELTHMFLQRISNEDKSTTNFLNNMAEECKKSNDVMGYVNQMCMNKVYEIYKSTLPDIHKAYNTIKLIHDNPYSNLIDKFADKYYNELKMTESTFTIIGSRIEYEHRDYDFYTDSGDVKDLEEDATYFIVIKHDNSCEYFELECYSYQDSCYSGWCSSNYASCNIKRVKDVKITAKYKGNQKVSLNINDIDKLNNSMLNTQFDIRDFINSHDYYSDMLKIGDAMTISFYGGDEYYPEGYVSYNPDVFTKPSIRQFDCKPVWIFKGDSGAGKTYLSDFIVEKGYKKKFETDAFEVLPDAIIADIVVIGNKYDYEIEDITSRIPLTFTPIIVDFTKKDKIEKHIDNE